MLSKLKQAPTSLTDRIAEIHREIEALIDKRAAELKAECPNQPIGVLRMILTRGDCLCTVGRRLTDGD